MYELYLLRQKYTSCHVIGCSYYSVHQAIHLPYKTIFVGATRLRLDTWQFWQMPLEIWGTYEGEKFDQGLAEHLMLEQPR